MTAVRVARGADASRDDARPCAARLAARDQQLAQREHRGVGRQRVQRRVAVGAGRRRRRRARRRGPPRTWIRAGSTPAYFSRTARSAARVPLQVTRRIRPAQQLEVGVPDPGDVAAVGDVVVEHPEQVVLAGLERERAQHLVRAGRVLDEQDPQLARLGHAGVAASRERSVTVSARPKAAPRARRPGRDRLERHLQRARERGGGERVVDVVEAGQRQRDLAPRPAGVRSVKRAARTPSQGAPRCALTAGVGRDCPQLGQW